MPDLLLPYFARTAPGLVLGVALLALLPRSETLGRILVYVMLFVLARDVMTPLGMWVIGGGEAIWIRLTPDPALLLVLGFVSALAVLVINRFEPALERLLVWRKGPPWQMWSVGLLAPLVLFVPILLSYQRVPIEMRGGAVPAAVLPAILVMSMLGNLLEEVLFRGYLQGWCEQLVSPLRAVLLAGLLFGFGHIFLAATVTSVGLPILAFTLYEGLACAFIRMKWGLVPAALTHGGLIFLLASGIA